MVSNEFIGDDYDPENDIAVSSQEKAKRANLEKEARGVLETRKNAYYRVFVDGQPAPGDRKLVLDDLARFCRYGTSAFDPDERIHCLQSGRQEAYLRIDDFTRLSVDELVTKYTTGG